MTCFRITTPLGLTVSVLRSIRPSLSSVGWHWPARPEYPPSSAVTRHPTSSSSFASFKISLLDIVNPLNCSDLLASNNLHNVTSSVQIKRPRLNVVPWIMNWQLCPLHGGPSFDQVHMGQFVKFNGTAILVGDPRSTLRRPFYPSNRPWR